MSDLFANNIVVLACPDCGHKFRKTIGWLEAHRHLTCSTCGTEITFDTKQMREGLRVSRKAVKDLLRRFGK